MIQNWLLATAACCLSILSGNAAALDFSVNGQLSSASPTFNRPTDRSGWPDSANDMLPYNVIEIRTGALGGTLAAVVDPASQFDSFLALYSTFDPANPRDNLLQADDDSGVYPHAALTQTGLAANTSYFLVVTSYANNPDAVFPLYGTFGLELSGDLVTYSVAATASPLAGGSVSCSPDLVLHGSSSTCSATPSVNYHLSGFSGDCSGDTCVLGNITANRSVTATFELNSYAITTTVSPLDGGGISCSHDPVEHGQSSICSASAASGYRFVEFSGDCSGVNCILINVTSARSVSALFELVEGGSCGSASGNAATFAPTSNLCATGIAQTPVITGLLWNWTCDSVDGGASASCTAPLAATGNGSASAGVEVSGGTWRVGPLSAGLIPASGSAGSPPYLPANISFPYGLLDLHLIGGTVGTSATVKITYSMDLPANAVWWKYGKTADDPTDHWYPYPNAVFDGRTVTLTLTDGGPGDDDRVQNWEIRDPGGPGIAAGVLGIPGLSEWGIPMLSLLLALAGMRILAHRSERGG